MSKFSFLNGKIVPNEDAKVSIFDVGILRGFGIYEGITCINGKPFRFEDHWNRFVSGAHTLGLNIPITEESASKKIKELIEKNNFSNVRSNIRFILTGGNTTDGLNFQFEEPTFYMISEEWQSLPIDLYTNGGKLITYNFMRDLPEYKTTNYIRAVNLQPFKRDENAIEVLYVSDGNVLECATSNIFIIKNKKIITPAENILKGITRKVVIELASQNYEIEERFIREEELKNADEVFITSSFKDLLPIVKIDDFDVSDGQVGPITKDLMNKFKANLYSSI